MLTRKLKHAQAMVSKYSNDYDLCLFWKTQVKESERELEGIKELERKIEEINNSKR